MNESHQGPYNPSSSDQHDAPNPALRDALRALSANGPAGASTLTPSQLSELTQHLARSGGTASADLARLAGGFSAGSTEPSGPVGPQSVICSIGDIPCAFPGELVQGIERLPDITPVPNTASWVLGVVQLRGVIHSVVDLNAFFDRPPTTVTNRTRLLLVGLRGLTIGAVVDAVLELRGDVTARPGSSGQSLGQWIAPFSAGVADLGGRPVQLIDVQRLLFSGKMQRYGADGG